jgi:hypothetical protein
MCKYGADPLYYDDVQNVRYSNFTYQFYTRTVNAVLTGNYSLTFFDAYGENWQTRAIDWAATCDTVIAALEELPNNVIPADSVRCYKSAATTAGSTHGQDSTIDPIYDTAMYVYSKYTLAFPGNPGNLPQISINKYLDGNRPTLYTNEATSTLGWHIYPNGFIGEDVDMVPDLCEDVTVTLVADTAYHTLGGLTTASTKLLKKCLGDGDGNTANNVDTYDWDTGDVYNPHLIKLVDATQDTSIVTVDNSGDADVDNQLAKYPVSRLCNKLNNLGVSICHDRDRPGFFAVIYYHTGSSTFRVFTRAAKDFSSTTQFYVFTTKGHLQMVNKLSAAFTTADGHSDEEKIARYHSNVVNLAAGGSSLAGYMGQVDCETTAASVGTDTYTLDCLKKDDYVMLLTTMSLESPGNAQAAEDLAANPAYPNLYRVKKISREPISSDNTPTVEAVRHQVVLDYSLNTDFRFDTDFTAAGDTSASFYKFYPPPAANQYAYAGECSHRGICNTKTGLCQCFPGYSSDNCGEVNAMSH